MTMPIYEYTCTKCGKDFEELVFGDDLPACPHCGAAETRKLMPPGAHCSGGSGYRSDGCRHGRRCRRTGYPEA